MRAIAEEGRGLVIYEHQEGRGIGLMAKLQAYSLQDAGLDTIDANHALGFEADCRDFSLPIAILHDLGIHRVRILTNNPHKSRALYDAGIEVAAQLPCEAAPTPHSLVYLRTKKEKMGHALSLRPHEITKHTTSEQAENLRDHFQFASIDDAISEVITPEAINLMATHGRGLICLAMTGERVDELALAPMAPGNTAVHGTAFTVSIDAIGHGVTTGISAHDLFPACVSDLISHQC